jgi:hypothetical protein
VRVRWTCKVRTGWKLLVASFVLYMPFSYIICGFSGVLKVIVDGIMTLTLSFYPQVQS